MRLFSLVSVSSFGLFTYARKNDHLLFWLISFASFLQMNRPKKNLHCRWMAYHSNCPCRFPRNSMSFFKKREIQKQMKDMDMSPTIRSMLQCTYMHWFYWNQTNVNDRSKAKFNPIHFAWCVGCYRCRQSA